MLFPRPVFPGRPATQPRNLLFVPVAQVVPDSDRGDLGLVAA